jgi:hypothetical protein
MYGKQLLEERSCGPEVNQPGGAMKYLAWIWNNWPQCERDEWNELAKEKNQERKNNSNQRK